MNPTSGQIAPTKPPCRQTTGLDTSRNTGLTLDPMAEPHSPSLRPWRFLAGAVLLARRVYGAKATLSKVPVTLRKQQTPPDFPRHRQTPQRDASVFRITGMFLFREIAGVSNLPFHQIPMPTATEGDSSHIGNLAASSTDVQLGIADGKAKERTPETLCARERPRRSRFAQATKLRDSLLRWPNSAKATLLAE